jgi:hypothetical protein
MSAIGCLPIAGRSKPRVWAGANSVARSSALGRRKAFFFEKKKQKTFIYRCQRLIGPYWCAGWKQLVKVFCFFFSKKKAFLPSLTPHGVRPHSAGFHQT